MVRESRTPVAIESYQHAVARAPDRVEVHLALARALRNQHKFREAAESFQRAVKLNPSDLQAQIGVGTMLYRAGELTEALHAYVGTLRLFPNCAEALTNLGVVCQELGDLALAADMHRQAIANAPEMIEAHNNLGAVLSREGETEAALACFRRVLALDPNHAGAHINRGHILASAGELEAAEKSYRRALACAPDCETARFHLGVLHLSQGRFSEGWQEYESRWGSEDLRGRKRQFSQPQWRGEALNDDSILLYAEQGLGDTMQFVRYAPIVAARGGRVVLEVQPGLRRLVTGMEGVAQVLSHGESLPDFDWQCPLMSVPLAFKTEVESIPCSVPYLRADAAEVKGWSQRLKGNGLRVGLAWGGNPRHQREKLRSIPFAELAALSAIEGVHLYSLQKGPATSQIRDVTSSVIVDLDAEQKDFADTAAIVANLDLVISIDTSVAHLAGALGKPVWVLLHHAPDWRWLLERQDSPWYPTARLIRKAGSESWREVVARLSQDLKNWRHPRLRQE